MLYSTAREKLLILELSVDFRERKDKMKYMHASQIPLWPCRNHVQNSPRARIVGPLVTSPYASGRVVDQSNLFVAEVGEYSTNRCVSSCRHLRLYGYAAL